MSQNGFWLLERVHSMTLALLLEYIEVTVRRVLPVAPSEGIWILVRSTQAPVRFFPSYPVSKCTVAHMRGGIRYPFRIAGIDRDQLIRRAEKVMHVLFKYLVFDKMIDDVERQAKITRQAGSAKIVERDETLGRIAREPRFAGINCGDRNIYAHIGRILGKRQLGTVTAAKFNDLFC